MSARGGRAEHPELPLVHTDRARLVAAHTAERNHLLRRVSKTVRTALGTETPAHFRVTRSTWPTVRRRSGARAC